MKSRDASGENTGGIDFEMLAGTWYLDAEADAPSIRVFDENGGWELLERPSGDGNPTTVDSGTVELVLEGSEEVYLAVSSQFDDVGYEFTLLDHDTLQLDSIFPEASLMDIDTVDPYRSLYFSLCY